VTEGNTAQAERGDHGRGLYLQSLQRGIAVLEHVARGSGLTARQITEQTGLDRTVVHRVLRTLELEGLLVKDGSRYVNGPRSLLLGNQFLAQFPLRAIALPYQVDLLFRTFTGRPWRVAVLTPVGAMMALVSEIWSPTAPLDTVLGLLYRPIDEAASGRCVLAYLPADKVATLLGPDRAAGLAPRLQAIRAADGVDYVSQADHPQGYAAGLSVVAAAIRRRDGEVVGSLVVSGPDLEPSIARDSEVARQVLRSAKQIGQMLP
jgi:IclR family transcriptional regulator, acetate operon repressor